MSRKSCTGSWTPTLLTGVTCAAAGRERSDDDATPAPSALAATTPMTVTLPTRIYPPCRPRGESSYQASSQHRRPGCSGEPAVLSLLARHLDVDAGIAVCGRTGGRRRVKQCGAPAGQVVRRGLAAAIALRRPCAEHVARAFRNVRIHSPNSTPAVTEAKVVD